MKALTLTLILTLTCTNVFASDEFQLPGPEVVVTEDTGKVSIYGLRCTKPIQGSAEENKIYTELGNRPALHIISEIKSKILLKHASVTAAGCKESALNEIVNDAGQSYNFQKSVLKLTQSTRTFMNMFYHKCISELTETLEIDLGRGIKLTSQQVRLTTVDKSKCK